MGPPYPGRVLTTSARPDDPEAVELLDEYFAGRVAGWRGAAGYRVPSVDVAAFLPPRGAFLLARDAGELIGCGGVRLLDEARAEVKHLYLREHARGQGRGRELLARLETVASGLGARSVVLDTNATLAVAQALYRSAGYREVQRYNDNPNATHWFAKDLG
jgi:GNAT superfamily N-acetyltransferase